MHQGKRLRAVVAAILLAVVGCDDRQSQYTPTSSETAAKRPLFEADYLALGDSYTIGEGVKVGDTFPWQLHVALSEAGFDVGKPVVVARTGWTTTDLLNVMSGFELPEKPYRLVTLLIGVNDQFRGRPVQDFEPDFEKLLDVAIEAAGGEKSRVIVVSIPDYLVTPSVAGMRNERTIASLKAYNNAVKQRAGDRGVRYVEITEGSRTAEDDVTMLADDGLHPSAKQYAQWVKAIVPIAKEALQNEIDKTDPVDESSEAALEQKARF